MKPLWALILATLVTLVSAAGFFGDRLWVFDLAANFRMQLAVLCFLVLVVVAAAESLPAAGIAAIGLLLNGLAILPLYLDAPRAETAELSVLSFNVLASNEQYDDVIDHITRTEADIVFLHEATQAWENALGRASLNYNIITTREPEFAFGTVALIPADAEVVNHGFSRFGNRAIEIRYGDYAVLGIHPLAPYPEWSSEARDDQLRFASEWAWALGRKAVVIGDFNATPWSFPFREMLTRGLVNTQVGFGTEATWRTGTIWQLPIDHAVITDDLAVVTREVGPELGSDHRPLYLEVGARPRGS